MPDLPGSLVVVTWEPVLHLISKRDGYTWRAIHFNRTAKANTQCGQEVTGYIDNADNHVVTCIVCLGS